MCESLVTFLLVAHPYRQLNIAIFNWVRERVDDGRFQDCIRLPRVELTNQTVDVDEKLLYSFVTTLLTVRAPQQYSIDLG